MFYFILSIYPPKCCLGVVFSDRHIWRNAILVAAPSSWAAAPLVGAPKHGIWSWLWAPNWNNASAKKASLKWWLWQRYECPTTTSETIFAHLELVRGFSIEDLQRPFELIRSEGSLSHPENGGHRVSTKMLEATCQALWNVSAARAQSSLAADKYQIWEETANEAFRITIKGVGAERWFKGFIDDNGPMCWQWSSATSIATYSRYFPLRCLRPWWLGATLLQRPCAAFQEHLCCRNWEKSLVEQHAAGIQCFHGKAAFGAGCWCEGSRGGATAWMFAQGGHEAVAKLLLQWLQHAAEVRAAMHSNARWQDSTDDC